MKPANDVPISALHEWLAYDPDAGDFFWKARPRNTFLTLRSHNIFMKLYPGRKAGRTNKRGYVHIRVAGRSLAAHRIAWAMTHGEYPAEMIDHINGDPGDNRIANLREASNMQNQCNRAVDKDSPSGIKGVRLVGSRWRASITVNGKCHDLGAWPTAEEAKQRRADAEIQMQGSFSILQSRAAQAATIPTEGA